MIKGKFYLPPITKVFSSIGSLFTTNSSISTSGIEYTPPVVNASIPKKVVASELLNESLNTQERKISGAFTFNKCGAIQVGEFDQGVSGELKISPTGIAARNKDGVSTFALDGETGDATFSGSIKAADVTVVDKEGLVSLSNFSQSNTTAANYNQSIAGTNPISYTDLTNASFTITLTRSTVVLLLANVLFYQVGGPTSGSGTEIRFVVDGSSISYGKLSFTDAVLFHTGSMHYLTVLGAGTHTLKLEGGCYQASGTVSLTIYGYRFSYLTLGS